MSAYIGHGAAVSTATRQPAEILGASSTQSDPTPPIHGMMYLHRPTTKMGPGDAANAPDPAPETPGSFT